MMHAKYAAKTDYESCEPYGHCVSAGSLGMG